MVAERPVGPEALEQVVGPWLRGVEEEDRVFPKNKKVEVVFLVEAVNAILPRTEGVEDITLFRLPGTSFEVPAILPEKLQAVSRRRMLASLRRFRDERSQRLKTYLERLSALYKEEKTGGRGKKKEPVVYGFAKAEEYAGDPARWNCYIQPPGGDVGGGKQTDVGMDGFCPACALFGTVLDGNRLKGVSGESIGVKSRVEFDPAIAVADRSKSVVEYTHNKVADGVSWTGQSLFSEPHVHPGTVFVGKVTLEDVTLPELKAFLATLAGIDRLGGRERLFGGVRVHLLGIRGGSYETVSALELARRVAEEFNGDLVPVEKVAEKVLDTIREKGFTPLDTEAFRKLLDDMDLWDSLWRSTVCFDKSVVRRVIELLRGPEKIEEVPGKEGLC